MLPGEGALVRRDGALVWLPGRAAEACAQALAAGPRPAEAAFAEMSSAARPLTLQRQLGAMREDGLIVEDDGAPRRGALEIEDLDPDATAQAGVSVHDRWAALPDPPRGRVWTPLIRGGGMLAVGPVFRPDRRGLCLACLRARAAEHDDLARLLASRPQARKVQEASAPRAEIAREAVWVAEALARLAGSRPGAILLRSRDGGVIEARALRRGGCAQCGAPSARSPASPDAEAPLRDGGYRPLDPAELIARLQGEVVDPVSGIVRELEAFSGANACTAVARHAFPLADPDPEAVIRNRRGRSAGKGRTPQDAAAGALAEALERYAGIGRHGDVHLVARASDLDAPAIDPASWSLYSARQLEDAAAWQALNLPAAWSPDPLAPDAPIGWTRVRDACDGTPGWAPAALCWHQLGPVAGASCPGRADSNGCAAGQTRTDAELQALLELVERDAVAIWWWNRIRRPRLDPRSFDDRWLLAAQGEVEERGYELSLFDLTHDLGVPVVAASAWPRGGRGPLLLGFGAHPAGRIAAARAVTELAQALPEEAADRIGGDPRADFGRIPGAAAAGATAEEELAFLAPRGPAEAELRAPPPPPHAAEARERLLARLREAGLRVWALDQSRPDVPLPVVRMIAPGLRHFRPRFAPGRLERVPRALGWRGDGPNTLFIPQ